MRVTRVSDRTAYARQRVRQDEPHLNFVGQHCFSYYVSYAIESMGMFITTKKAEMHQEDAVCPPPCLPVLLGLLHVDCGIYP